MKDMKEINQDMTSGEKEHYRKKAKAVKSDIGRRVLFSVIILSLIASLASMLFQPQNGVVSDGYSLKALLWSLILITLSLLEIGLSREIILHSRNIKDFDGISGAFSGLKNNTLSQYLASFLVGIILSLVVFLTTLTAISKLYLITIILLFFNIFFSMFLNIVKEATVISLSIRSSKVLERFKYSYRKAKETGVLKEYIKINIIYFFKVLGISILMFLPAVSMKLLLLMIITIPVGLYYILKLYVEVKILSSIIIGDYILDDLLKEEYGNITPQDIYIGS